MARRILIRDLFNRNHPLSPVSDRVVFTGLFFVASILVATLVIHFSEGWNLTNSFYYIAMVTTTNGAPFPPTTAAITMFTSLWAYYSFILLATIVTLAFGPMVGYLVKEGGDYLKKAEKSIENSVHEEESRHRHRD